MDQPQSVRPAGVARPARRSLAEFALPATDMAEELPAEELPAAASQPPTIEPVSTAQHDAQPSTAVDNERRHVKQPSLNEDHEVDADGSARANHPKAGRDEDDALLHQFEEITLAAAKAAKDYRFLMLEHMKINMTVALNCVSGVAAVGSQVASTAHCNASEHRTDPHSQSVEEAAPTDGKTAQEYGVKALGFMTANMNTTLEYAQRLARAKTPSEFVELTASQARKQIELMVEQTSELGSIARKLAPHDIASMASSFAKLLGERKE